MKRLIVNAGSSSLRVSIFELASEIAGYTISGIWQRRSELSSEHLWEKNSLDEPITNHTRAFELIFDALFSQSIIENVEQVVWVAHRVVHWGSYFSKAVVINSDVMKKIENCIELAPLHNPINIECIISCYS